MGPHTSLRVNILDRVFWQDLAAKVDGCADGSSFATFLSGPAYVLGAACLARSLRKAGNRCPIDLIYDDRALALNLTGEGRNYIEQVFGVERLVPLSRLFAKYPESAADMSYSLLNRSLGRRLFQPGVQQFATHLKLWFWALPRSRVVVLDSDMVVVGNLDWLTFLDFREDLAAIDIGNRRSNDSKFNSGIMVIRPSRAHLGNLTRLARLARDPAVAGGARPEAVPKAGEKRFGDQSLLNWHFRNAWKALPASLTRAVHSKLRTNFTRLLHLDYQRRVTDEGLKFSAPAVMHWLGEPKPWSLKAGLHVDAAAWDTKKSATKPPSPHTRLWWQLCRDHLRDAPLRWRTRIG